MKKTTMFPNFDFIEKKSKIIFFILKKLFTDKNDLFISVLKYIKKKLKYDK